MYMSPEYLLGLNGKDSMHNLVTYLNTLVWKSRLYTALQKLEMLDKYES
jgi:hypothetical protein